MSRCSIIVHSVNGNSYIIASYLEELLKERGVDARLYRVEDPDLHIWANQSDTANDYYEEISSLPVASKSTLEKSRMVIMGCPTSFGNVSSEMKAFMESTYTLAEEGSMQGRYFACFTSALNFSEGSLCLANLIHFGNSLGMLHVPMGVRGALERESQPVSGIVHVAGQGNRIRPSSKLGEILALYSDTLAGYLK